VLTTTCCFIVFSPLQVRPEFINDWVAKLWSRFFCLSVYITMYLNDHQRSAFYESLGLNTTQVRRLMPCGQTCVFDCTCYLCRCCSRASLLAVPVE
jgi:hypothetical protein